MCNIIYYVIYTLKTQAGYSGMHVLVAGKGMRGGGKGAANIFQVSKLSTGDFWELEIFLMDLFGDFGREFFEGFIQ